MFNITIIVWQICAEPKYLLYIDICNISHNESDGNQYPLYQITKFPPCPNWKYLQTTISVKLK